MGLCAKHFFEAHLKMLLADTVSSPKDPYLEITLALAYSACTQGNVLISCKLTSMSNPLFKKKIKI